MESTVDNTKEEPASIVDSESNRFAANDKTNFDELNEKEKKVIQSVKRYSTLIAEDTDKIGKFDEVYYRSEAQTNLWRKAFVKMAYIILSYLTYYIYK